MTTVRKDGLQQRLEIELERLKQNLGLGYPLEVKWTPNKSINLSGEVKGNLVYIYEENEDLAMKTLRHEFLDHVVSEVIEPYKEVTNALISSINKNAYKRKERLVEALAQLM